jgi:hypothetical protein
VRRDDPRCVVGILSRSDLLAAYAGRMQEAHGHDVPEDGAAVPSPS